MAFSRITNIDLATVYKSLHHASGNGVSAEQYLCDPNSGVIDVRSPSEFVHGHIPGAKSVPLFTDEERSLVGTTYKQQGQEPAITLGLQIAKRKLADLSADLEVAIGEIREQFGGQSRPLIHCWRGGMRSRSMKWLGEQLGYQLNLLDGGYKAFRRAGVSHFKRAKRIVVLAGPTGSGKTRILEQIANQGQRVIDLEALANHRGSVFGGYVDRPQPSTEQFQNDLLMQWVSSCDDQVVWFEGESQVIGRVVIPEELWQQLTVAPMIFVDADVEKRVRFLLEDYGSRDLESMINAATRIKKRLGGLRYQEAVDSAKEGNWEGFCRVMLEYYDKYYLKALDKRGPEVLRKVKLEKPGRLEADVDIIALAETVCEPPKMPRQHQD